ncbi:MAG: hypothetical protein M0R39_02845 [Prolixibacteraceae bacterium]|jgi:peptidoglycan/LPS O-acetylase OafA/YrhL|nr:hypothetical protein [Prolixibacteraceae bacterium]
MKRGILIFILAALVLIASGFWIFSLKSNLDFRELISVPIILLIVLFAVFIGIKRIKSMKRGQPAEDELSKKVLIRTASLSYYVSIYWWLVLGFFSDKLTLENHTLIGIGILGMAVIYALSWIFFNYWGLKDE